MLRARVRSSNFPCFGTEIVYGDNLDIPSPLLLTTVKVIVRIVVEGRGNDKYMNGSNVTETFLQTGQTNVDLY